MVEQRVRPKRLNGRGVLTGTAVAAVLVGIFAATGVGTSLMGVAGHGTDPTYRCIADGALVVHIGGPPSGSRAASVLSLTWKAVNDEDSGFAGYWALDTYTTTLNVWHLNKGVYKGDYYWEQTFSGVFQVPQGANSPGETGVTPNNVSEPASGYGTFLGGEEGFITPSETFTAGSHPVHGNLGTINYNGTVADLLKGYYANGQTGDVNPYNWYTTYFLPKDSGNANLNTTAWGFVYTLNTFFQTNPFGGSDSSNLWCNFGAGDFGDIVPAA